MTGARYALYVGVICVLFVLPVAVFAAMTDDQLCYGVTEGVVIIDTDSFIQCLDGYALQEVGGSMYYNVADLGPIDATNKQPVPINESIQPVGYSDLYGYIYATSVLVASTSSYVVSPLQQWMLLLLLLILVIYALILLLPKKQKHS